jgi:glycosyltransferase involved in cell wall biosynthesis
MVKKIGFVSTRFAGTDGVTLEAGKWAKVLTANGNECFWMAGELDRNPKRCHLVPEAHFKYEKNLWINDRVVGHKGRKAAVTETIHAIKALLKIQIQEFIDKFSIDLIIAENVLTIPMHIPLGIALTEFIAETQIPTIAHHHDFYWERTRYTVNAVGDYLRMAFPPNLPNVEHVVINSDAQEQLALRTGISSIIIPNVLDFENPPENQIQRTQQIWDSMDLSPDDLIILQPTRVVQRKGIEYAIELVQELNDPKYKLIISHEAGDEGFEYAEWLIEGARKKGVDLRFVNTQVRGPFNDDEHQPEQYTLWDIYPCADFITYPSLYEGFGNAFLEAIYFKKAMLINRYSIFIRDIEPKNFDLVVMDGYLTKNTIKNVRDIIENPVRKQEMVDRNYKIAQKYFSFQMLRRRLSYLMNIFFGDNGI